MTASHSEFKYFDNTKPLIFAIAEMIKKINSPEEKSAERLDGMESKDTSVCPVILIDGPAGTGKSTFTLHLLHRLKELEITPCFFEQDRFGVDREKRDASLINPCSDLARDPATVDKLLEVMAGNPAFLPEYDRKLGKRYKDRIKLDPGSVVVYEGVSCLSSVIYDNPKFTKPYQDAAIIKIFFTTDTEATLYKSRLKRDVEERNANPLDFKRQWAGFDRNNHLYTERGKQNANIIITRTATNTFEFTYAKPIVFRNALLESDFFSAHLLRPDAQRAYHQDLIQQRDTILAFNRKRWFDDHFVVLNAALSCRELNSKVRKDLMVDFYLTMISNNPDLTHDTASYHYYAQDDFALAKSKLLREVLEIKVSLSRDDSFLYFRKKKGFFAEQALLHDARFNSKKHLSVENALAAVVLDNYEAKLSPAVMRVSQSLLKPYVLLVNKCLNAIASAEEEAILDFLIQPFMAESKDMELGKFPAKSDATATPVKEVALWLVERLKDSTPSAFFTNMRFHIRFMHLITGGPKDKAPSVYESFMALEMISKLKNVRAQVKDSETFGGERRLGRIAMEAKKTTSLTSQFGTFIDIADILPPFRRLISDRTLPLHSAGKKYIYATKDTTHNDNAVCHDIPLIASASGAMTFLMCASEHAELKEGDKRLYHLACLANLIGGGHHSLSECLAVSQLCMDFPDTGIRSLIPSSLHAINSFKELIELTDELNLENLWVRLACSEAKGESAPARTPRMGVK